VELDKNVEKSLEDNKLKPRHHIGKNKLSAQNLPKHILSAITKVTGDYPIKAIAEEGAKLNRYVKARHLPAEDFNIKEKIRDIERHIEENPEKYRLKPRLKPRDEMDEEYEKKEQEMRSNLVQRILKQRVYSWQSINFDEFKSLSYLFGRSSQEFAVLLRIFNEIQKRDPAFKPRSYFDFGSGVGTGCWAVSELWKECIYEYYLVDASKHMNDLLDLILRNGDVNKEMFLRNVYQRQFLPAKDDKYDLVLSAFSMFELPTLKNRLETISNLFSKCSKYLVFVENGSNAGFRAISEIREFVMELAKSKNEEWHVFSPVSY
jgi:hypothetical protein